jgi:hypothetical protein
VADNDDGVIKPGSVSMARETGDAAFHERTASRLQTKAYASMRAASFFSIRRVEEYQRVDDVFTGQL